MKKATRLILLTVTLLLLGVLVGCDVSQKTKVKTKSTNNVYNDWYNEVITGLELDDIKTEAKKAGAVSEYRVVYNVALLRYDYYSLQVFKDGSGEFTFMVHKGEDFENGRLVLDKTKNLTAAEVNSLLAVMEKEKFWSIPTKNPEEEMGTDGTTIFAEGYKDGKTHFIKMWQPDETYGIYNIHNVFAKFADSFAKRPEIKVE